MDYELVKKLRKESVEKYNLSDSQQREINDITYEIRAMEHSIRNMRDRIEVLNQSSHKLRVEADRLKNQAFVMSLGAFNE